MKEKITYLNLRKEKLRAILRNHKVKRLAIFGSYVSGKPHKYSDVDFLAEFKKEADLLDQVGLKLDLEELLKRKVDVVTPNSLSRYFRKRVMKEAVYL